MKPLFISGIGRSGTSAVLKSLARHEMVVEPKKLGEAPFVTAFLEFLDNYEKRSPNAEYNKKNYCLEPDVQHQIFSDLIVKIQCGLDPNEYSSDHLWIAKTSLPEPSYDKAEELFGDVRCVHIMRNGIEVVNSAKKFEGFKSLTFEALCKRWSSNIDNCKFLQSREKALYIRHDELVSDPVSTYCKVYLKLGMREDIAPARWISENLFNSSFDKTQSGLKVNEAFKNRLEDAWNEWSQNERDVFLKICGHQMEEYSFDIPGNSTVVNKTKTNKNTSISTEISSVYEGKMKPQIFNYICNVSKKHNYLFVNNAKVASTSILRLLQQNECLATADMLASPHIRHQSPLDRLSDLEPEEQKEFIYSTDIFRFCFVRDPFSRILSAYKSKVERPLNGFTFDPDRPASFPPKGQILSLINGKKVDGETDFKVKVSFHEFLEAVCSQEIDAMDIHWKPQHNLLCVDNITYDFVGKFESLEKDMLVVANKIGLSSQFSLGLSKNRTDSSVLLERYYTPDLIVKVVEKFGRDFEVFDYTTDILPVEVAV